MKLPPLFALWALSAPIVAAFTALDPLFLSRQQRVSVSQLRSSSAKSDKDQIEKFQVSSSRGSNAIKKGSYQEEGLNGWASLKKAVYGTVDGVGAIGAALKSKSSELPVEEGYRQTETTILKESNSVLSPGQRLMNQYRERSTVAPPAPAQDQSKSTAFDAFKETVYGTIDVASSVFDDQPKDTETRRSFKPLVQSTLSSPEIQKALPDLQSNNFIARKIAEKKIQDWEKKERKRQLALEREEAARKIKESVYQVGDATVWAAKTLATAPEAVSKVASETTVFVKGTVKQVQTNVDQAVSTATAIPSQVTATADDVQNAVKESVEKTKQTVEEVKAIPGKTKKLIDDTTETVTNVKSAVEEAVVDTKVFLGLEKAKPKPPKRPPPPPQTASEIGLEIAGKVLTGAATGTAKLAWWAGASTAKAAWNATVSAIQERTAKDEAGSTSVAVTSNTTSPAIDKEVEEALLLAQSAIDFADTPAPDDDDEKKKAP
ncbi:expressed unknown protein [Seminavis robusta]|uniref:Uncharacterized protein n=1 Tax=Seminavis robusta TaxID=568900 RepID=A0A9N8HAK8_9STRA|nr:expressed unknown protein [Seminavis robusta]|eukprot:Sro245_g097530.1 n/a (490) ;mRNA; f:69741-71210